MGGSPDQNGTAYTPTPMQSYIHTTLDAKPRSTPEYFRLFLSAIPMRYGPRAFMEWWSGKQKAEGKIAADQTYKYDRWGDTAVGTLSLGITTLYTKQTAHDIKLGFSELVGLELGKPAHQVTWKDFSRSNNILVQSTMDVFKKRTFFRYLTDLPFFARWIPAMNLHHIDATYLGLFSKGMLLLTGVTGRNETFFETLVDIMDKRINPSKGLGDHVHTTDLVTLYQQYAAIEKSHVRFIGLEDRKIWAKSEILFTRMAELMNHTYQYSSLPGEDTNAKPLADFPMPKFLYLLGFGMIDPRHVKQSLAYVEVANKYGIESVKSLHQALKDGQSLDEALKEFPVTLPTVNHPIPPSPHPRSGFVEQREPAASWSERTSQQSNTPASPSV